MMLRMMGNMGGVCTRPRCSIIVSSMNILPCLMVQHKITMTWYRKGKRIEQVALIMTPSRKITTTMTTMTEAATLKRVLLIYEVVFILFPCTKTTKSTPST
uniref:Core protein VP3 n=1 Tax=Lygus hesperus TaxID=30085 RepID=A0A0A9YM99_LYGHE